MDWIQLTQDRAQRPGMELGFFKSGEHLDN
jgi:hypothetical protein